MVNETESGARKTIVLCDDNDEILEIYGLLLEKKGYKVGRAQSGAELLPMLKELRPDLLIMDIQMPEKDGFDVLEEMRALGLTLPVFFMTAHDHFMYRRVAPMSGVAEYLIKPLDPDTLYQKIDSVLHTKSNAQPAGDSGV